MESYAYRTSDDLIGFFQKKSDEVFIIIESHPACKVRRHSWREWDERGRNLGYSKIGDDNEKAAYYFLNAYALTGCVHTITEFVKLPFDAGTYYPRINNLTPELYQFSILNASATDEIRAFFNICDTMEDIFKVIEPDVKNNKCFGHRIRELLTLACIEVEHLLLHTLKGNSYPRKSRYSTNDYVKLLPIQRLNEFEVSLKMYLGLGSFIPFKNWSNTDPTKSLSWYSAYNSAKHDRRANAHLATLEEMVNSIAAIYVLLVAQYGSEIFERKLYSTYESCFSLDSKPSYKLNLLTPPIFSENGNLILGQEMKYFAIHPAP
jgi:hypothetical protein